MEVFLDDNLTKKFSRSAFRMIEPSIDLVVLNAFEASPLQQRDLKDIISKNISLFGGLYLQILEKLPNTPNNKLISANLASKLVNNNKADNNQFNKNNSIDNHLLNIDYSTNSKLLISSIKNLEMASWGNPQITLNKHFNNLSTSLDNQVLKYNLPEVTVKTNNTTISSLKQEQNIKQRNTHNSKIKLLNEYDFTPVYKKDIIGNDELIEVLENRVSNLLHYNILEKENIFSFNKYSLLHGIPGTGKTFLAKYVLTYAKELAKKNNIPLKVVTLDFEDRWQNGPLENIKYQLSQISSGDKPYIVFIDELDLKFPTRANNNSRSQEQVLREFLKIRGDTYPVFNNYLFIATTNRVDNIDNALSSVFSKDEIKTTKSIDEKLAIFKLQIKNELINKRINWDKIKPYLNNEYITARILKLTGEKINEQISKFSKNIPYNLTNKEKQIYVNNFINQDKKMISTEFIVGNLNKIINEGKNYGI